MTTKYVYWLRAEEVSPVTKALTVGGHDVFTVRKAVCIPLADNVDIGLVPPEAWTEYQLCRRQMSWYGVSDKAGLTLLISSTDLASYGLTPEVVIEERPDFQPPRLPDRQGLTNLTADQAYQRAKPPAWDRLGNEERKSLEQWLKVMGLAQEDFDELFLSHCANHANFISPEFFVEEGGETVPYSVGPTVRVCSACLELYNIVGSASRKKLVVPCPGAVLFGRLKANRYYEVRRP